MYWMFERELFICIKIDLALNNLQMLICHKNQTNKQTNNLKNLPGYITEGHVIPAGQQLPKKKKVS